MVLDGAHPVDAAHRGLSVPRPGPRRQDSASAEAWVTEVLDVANAL
jgi:hypothetical protein